MRRALLVSYCMAIAALACVMPRTGHGTEPTKLPESGSAAAQAVTPAPAAAAHDDQSCEILHIWRSLGGSLLKGTLLEQPACLGSAAAQCESKAQCNLETDFHALLEAELTAAADKKATQQCEARYQDCLTDVVVPSASHGIQFFSQHPMGQGYVVTGAGYPTTAYPAPNYAPPRPVASINYTAPAYGPYPQQASSEGELAAVLRAASRSLDEKASDLEDMAAYDRSDELRRLSRRIRRVAREFQEDAATAEVARKAAMHR